MNTTELVIVVALVTVGAALMIGNALTRNNGRWWENTPTPTPTPGLWPAAPLCPHGVDILNDCARCPDGRQLAECRAAGPDGLVCERRLHPANVNHGAYTEARGLTRW